MTIERLNVTKLDTNGEEKKEEHMPFPSKISLQFQQADLPAYMENISNYSFMATMVIILSFFTMLGVIKQVTENHALA